MPEKQALVRTTTDYTRAAEDHTHAGPAIMGPAWRRMKENLSPDRSAFAHTDKVHREVEAVIHGVKVVPKWNVFPFGYLRQLTSSRVSPDRVPCTAVDSRTDRGPRAALTNVFSQQATSHQNQIQEIMNVPANTVFRVDVCPCMLSGSSVVPAVSRPTKCCRASGFSRRPS